jgi:nucleoside-diphosphate-sugar epimerase
MRVLLTGATGYIGSFTARSLIEAGHRPRVLIRNRARLDAKLAALAIDPTAVEVVVGDMTDADAVAAAAAGCDAAIHAAAAVEIFNKDDAERTVAINVDGTRNVVDAALAAGCDPVVHVSSIAVFGTPGPPVITTDLPPVAADNPYARAKALTEQFARDRQAEGKPVVIVYPTGVTGPAAGDSYGELAMGFVSMLKSGCLVTHDGGFVIVDVRDVAAGLVATLRPGRGARRFIFGSRMLWLPELGALIRELTGRRFPVLPIPGAVFRGLGHATDVVRRVAPFETVFTAEAMATLTLARPVDDPTVRDDLGIEYRDVAATVEASLRALHAGGLLSARQVGRLATRTGSAASG